jgi:hypothetical protein
MMDGERRRGGVYVEWKRKLAEMGSKISERGNSKLTSAGGGNLGIYRDYMG